MFAIVLGNPYEGKSGSFTSNLLKMSVVGIGFGYPLSAIAELSASSFYFVIIFSCTPKEVNTIKYKYRTEEVVNKDCKIAKEQKKLSRRNDVTSKNFMTH